MEGHQTVEDESSNSDSCSKHAPELRDEELIFEEFIYEDLSDEELNGEELSDEELIDEKFSYEELSDEEVLERMQIPLIHKMSYLIRVNDFSHQKRIDDLEFLESASIEGNREVREKLGDLLASLRVTDLFLKIWKKYFKMVILDNASTLMKASMTSIMSVLWNLTDVSRVLCLAVFRSDVPKVILYYLTTDFFHPSKTSDSRYSRVVTGLMSILFNMLQKIPESSNALRVQKAVGIFQRFRNCPSNEVACLSLVVQGYIVTDDDNEKINADDTNFIFFKNILQSALEPDNFDRRAHGYAASELVLALNRLAVNDKNKTRIVSVGFLPLYVQLLQSECSEDEQAAAVEGLWILAFKCAEAVKMEPGCEDALNRLKNAKSERVRSLVEGILWTLKEFDKKRVPKSNEKEGKHVFISYQCDSQPVVKRLAGSLKHAGFQVWLNLDNLAGSTMESMAKAVEEAAVVIVCLSQRYKESPNCRAEAEYTFQHRKNILPLRMQSGYWPDGWLGILTGSRLMHDVSSDEKFDESLRSIIKELGERGKAMGSKDYPNPAVDPIPKESEKTTEKERSSDCTAWTKEDIQLWLKNNNLEVFRDWIKDFDGDDLIGYKEMVRDAPESFYSTLKKSKFSVKDMIKFRKALKQL